VLECGAASLQLGPWVSFCGWISGDTRRVWQVEVLWKALLTPALPQTVKRRGSDMEATRWTVVKIKNDILSLEEDCANPGELAKLRIVLNLFA
jgi:hypothetical protein